MNRKIFISLAVALVAIGFVSSVHADSWALPSKKKYYSPNKKYYIEVTPKKLESQLQYFKDKVDGKENAGAAKEAKENRAKGAFYARRNDGGYSRKWEVALVNEVWPVHALVSDDGAYVVTFDNWHSVGYGDDVVVIYNAQGALIKKFGLADLLTEADIETLPHSVSSIWWGGKHDIDERAGLLVLKVVADGQAWGGDNGKFRDLKIELATGRPLKPKRDLLPQRVFSVTSMVQPSETAAAAAVAASTEKPTCASPEVSVDSPEAVRLPPEQIFAQVKAQPFPPYPPIAKAAHVAGTVVVEILISKTGDVLCARPISGHPLLFKAAVAAALNWKFDPFKMSDAPTTVSGTVAFEFKMEMKEMNPDK